jgi:hypothetical protein
MPLTTRSVHGVGLTEPWPAQALGPWSGQWLGVPMFFSSHDAEANRRLLAAANFELLVDEIIDTPEPAGPVPFLWVLAQRR